MTVCRVMFTLLLLTACGRTPDEGEPLDGSSGAFEGSSTGSTGSTSTPGGSSAADGSEGSTGVWGVTGGGDSGSTGEGTSTGVEDESGGVVCTWSEFLGCVCGGEQAEPMADPLACWCGDVEIPFDVCEPVCFWALGGCVCDGVPVDPAIDPLDGVTCLCGVMPGPPELCE